MGNPMSFAAFGSRESRRKNTTPSTKHSNIPSGSARSRTRNKSFRWIHVGAYLRLAVIVGPAACHNSFHGCPARRRPLRTPGQRHGGRPPMGGGGRRRRVSTLWGGQDKVTTKLLAGRGSPAALPTRRPLSSGSATVAQDSVGGGRHCVGAAFRLPDVRGPLVTALESTLFIVSTVRTVSRSKPLT